MPLGSWHRKLNVKIRVPVLDLQTETPPVPPPDRPSAWDTPPADIEAEALARRPARIKDGGEIAFLQMIDRERVALGQSLSRQKREGGAG